ncbi:MAG: AMP-binding protein [Bryobacteraceae bacterium]
MAAIFTSTGVSHRLITLRSVVQAFQFQGDRPFAVVFEKDTVARHSFRELYDLVERLARGLARTGVGPGDHVALLAGNRPEWITACFATVHAGAVIVPVDLQTSTSVLRHMLQDSAARHVFTTSDHAPRLEQLGLNLRLILLDAAEDDPRSWRRLLAEREGPLPDIQPDDCATLFYTSGTTGPPKGVPLSHRNIAFQIETILASGLVTERDRILAPLPLHHVYPFVVGMLTPLAGGMPLIVPYSVTGPQMVRALREGSATLVIGVPRLYSALYKGIQTKAQSAGWVGEHIFGALLGLSVSLRRAFGMRAGRFLLKPIHRQFGEDLRVLASGGAALDPALAWKLEAIGWQIAIGYGLTETAPLLTLNVPWQLRIGSAGRPIPGVELRIQEGEVQARGPNVFKGYRNLPEETREAFTEDGWFRTGDLGHFDKDGYLYLTGRVSTVIVTEAGKNIQPDEVEEAYGQSSVIAEVGVLQREGRLAALIVADRAEVMRRAWSEEDAWRAIHEAVAGRSPSLPSYQRISEYAVTREPLPRTRLGKIRRHLLAERYDLARAGKESGPQGPIAEEEMSGDDQVLLQNQAARQVWNLLASRYRDSRLTPDTSPQLDLGIDSMEWLTLSVEIGQRTGLELTEEAIARIDTVRDLMREVTEASEGEGINPALALERPEEVLTEEQKRWLEPLGPGMHAVGRTLHAVNWLLFRSAFRTRVRGLSNLPPDGHFVMVPNHVSYLDPFAISSVMGYRRLRETYWAGWTEAAFGNPVVRFFSRISRVVPIDLRRSAASSLAIGAALLRRGKTLVWFPEGQRSMDGRLQPFRPGIGMLLERYPVPVIPVHIEGAYAALPRGKAMPRPHAITITIGRPLFPRNLATEGAGDTAYLRIANALHDRVAEMADRHFLAA